MKEKIPEKARLLEQLRKKNFKIPDFVFVPASDLKTRRSKNGMIKLSVNLNGLDLKQVIPLALILILKKNQLFSVYNQRGGIEELEQFPIMAPNRWPKYFQGT